MQRMRTTDSTQKKILGLCLASATTEKRTDNDLTIIHADGRLASDADEARKSELVSEWRMQVFKRDKFACQECGSKKNIHAHHIIGWAVDHKKRFDITNGVTLCQQCHSKKHPEISNLIKSTNGKRHGNHKSNDQI